MNTKRNFINDDFRISQENFESSWTMPYAHNHNAYEIYILKTGKRIVTFDNEEFEVNAREATLFNSNLHHKSRGDVPFSGICIHFSKWFLEFFFTPGAVNELMKCFNEKIIVLNDDDFNKICKIADNFIYGDSSNFILLADILYIMNNSAKPTTAPVLPTTTAKSAAKSIIRFISEEYASIRTIPEISQRFGVSESYIYKIFREQFNTTPKHYINRLRIKNVCHYLKHTTRPAKQLSAESGFESYTYFLRVFKTETGVTPKEYRFHTAS